MLFKTLSVQRPIYQYYFNQDKGYKIQHARLHREISRPDFKEKVYQKLMKMITLDTDELDGIDIKSKML